MYGSLQEADLYHARMGRTEWADASSVEREAALERATTLIDAIYGHRFVGVRASLDQDNEWPRISAHIRGGRILPSDSVPKQVINATYEIAYIEVSEPGSISDVMSAPGPIKRERVDKIETEYAVPASAVATASAAGVGPVPLVEGLLRALLIGDGYDPAVVFVV